MEHRMKCKVCGLLKPLSLMMRDSRGKDGQPRYYARCRACNIESQMRTCSKCGGRKNQSSFATAAMCGPCYNAAPQRDTPINRLLSARW